MVTNLKMNRIDPKEAPEGYVARKPREIYKISNKGLCTGCDFMLGHTCLNTNPKEPFCISRERKDNRDVIFVKKKT